MPYGIKEGLQSWYFPACSGRMVPVPHRLSSRRVPHSLLRDYLGRTAIPVLLVISILMTLMVGCCPDTTTISPPAKSDRIAPFPRPQIAYNPRHYVCYRTDVPIVIDGRLDESSWRKASWTESFVDIEGKLKPVPRFETRAKMLWDSTHFYIAAELEEPDVWGILTQRDAVIFYDNDFEVFIDPDGDTHEYYELELNALNTVWDLLLIKPYRDGGPAVNAWDIPGLKTAVAVHGTINRPGDRDSGWSVEIALPWAVLRECAHKDAPPMDGDQWRLNFSRVEWRTEVNNDRYRKLADSTTGKPLPEDNWVWSPQGLVNMHYPEMWGIVQFTTNAIGTQTVDFQPDPTEPLRWQLYSLYYAEREYRQHQGAFTADFSRLDLSSSAPFSSSLLRLTAAADIFEAVGLSPDSTTTVSITQDGRLRRELR